MALNVTNTGNAFFGYHTTVYIAGGKYKISTLNGVDMTFMCNSTDTGDSGQSYVTFFNLAPSNTKKWKIHDYISVWTGPPKLFGKYAAGNITKIAQNNGDQDTSVTIYFDEAANDQAKQNPQDSGTKKVKGKQKSVKVNHTFPKNTKASAIINYITSKTGIKLARKKLKTNKSYKRGYTLSKTPFKALQGLATDCGSLFYFRKNQLVIDDGKADNPFKDHIYFTIGSGLIAQPTLTSTTKKTTGKGKQKKTVVTQQLWTLQIWLDPRVAAGSYIQVGSKTLNGFCRVKSAKGQKSDDGYTMEVVCYSKP